MMYILFRQRSCRGDTHPLWTSTLRSEVIEHSDSEAFWSIAEARKRFSDVVKAARAQPQIIRNRETPVAVLVSPDTFAEFAAWQATQSQPSVADAFDELRNICDQETLTFPPPKRKLRSNTFGA